VLDRQVSHEVDFAADASLVEHRPERINARASLHLREAGRNNEIVHRS
jgi:hypothetical protein